MVKVITNSEGSGDWVIVQLGNRTIHSGDNSISPRELVDIICHFKHCELVEVDDEQIEEFV